jgi:hypothetical protein
MINGFIFGGVQRRLSSRCLAPARLGGRAAWKQRIFGGSCCLVSLLQTRGSDRRGRLLSGRWPGRVPFHLFAPGEADARQERKAHASHEDASHLVILSAVLTGRCRLSKRRDRRRGAASAGVSHFGSMATYSA